MIAGNQLDLIFILFYHIAPVIIVRRKNPENAGIINRHLLYFLKMYFLHVQFAEFFQFRLIIINIAVILYYKEIVFRTSRHTVDILKILETLYSLPLCIEAVKSIISLYPQYIIIGFNNPFYQIAGKAILKIRRFV